MPVEVICMWDRTVKSLIPATCPSRYLYVGQGSKITNPSHMPIKVSKYSCVGQATKVTSVSHM